MLNYHERVEPKWSLGVSLILSGGCLQHGDSKQAFCEV